ncbi:MAG: DUF4412 domain-containing protein [Balneolaceae bacterium]|nr:DUF4412 domain-containing protein [Balneolaceae bacterium]
MKYLTLFVITSLISITFTVQAEAQIFNRLKQKAQEAAQQKVEEKIAEQVEQAAERMVERSWNSIFGDIQQDSLSGPVPFSMNSNVKTEEIYTFDTITTMEIETVKKTGKSDPPVTMHMHYNKDESYTGTTFSSEEMKKEDGELFIIYDFKNAAMLMLMSNDTDKFSFAYDWGQATQNAAEDTTDMYGEEVNWDEMDEWQGYTKIGSKNILGYDCDGYRSESEQGVIELWISRDVLVETNFMMFNANANAKYLKGKIPESYPYGTVMEMVSEDFESGDVTTLKMTEINKDTRVELLVADYPKMSFNPNSQND